ncbi:hypothetical protein VE03_09661 [Pseudogymnoascus sp. 23342-1-I1]|nr:hypothetical protein VE03_09661 [Pseudogymnoascus sp. 23342-1-I1]
MRGRNRGNGRGRGRGNRGNRGNRGRGNNNNRGNSNTANINTRDTPNLPDIGNFTHTPSPTAAHQDHLGTALPLAAVVNPTTSGPDLPGEFDAVLQRYHNTLSENLPAAFAALGVHSTADTGAAEAEAEAVEDSGAETIRAEYYPPEDFAAESFFAEAFFAEDSPADAFTARTVPANIVDDMAGPSRQTASAPPAPPNQAVNRDLAAQLQDLVFQPGGIPDLLPPGLTEMPGLDPNLLANLPPPPTEPLGDLGAQLRAAFAKIGNEAEAEAEGSSEQAAAPTKLVVVCCLATWIGTRDTDDKWVAMPAQGKRQGWGLDMANPSERECWRMQIWKGLEVLKQMNGEGVLMFSGGPWYDKSKISAATSYHDFAKASNFWGYFRGDKYKDYTSRIFTENRAMDSLQNIMFSLIEFNNCYGNFPEEMTVISYELKRERFEKLHFKTAKELTLPSAQPETDVSWQGVPTFIGIDPRELKQYSKSDKAYALMELEAQVFDIWKGSPFGLSGVLMGKKQKRNIHKIDLSYRLVIAAGVEMVAALERNAKEAPVEEVADMSVN